MKEKIKTILFILLGVLIFTIIFHLWLSMFGLKLNPNMLKKNCYCSNCSELEKSILSENEKNEGGLFSGLFDSQIPEEDKIYECKRGPIFIKK